jgi:hypothetical protein
MHIGPFLCRMIESWEISKKLVFLGVDLRTLRRQRTKCTAAAAELGNKMGFDKA